MSTHGRLTDDLFQAALWDSASASDIERAFSRSARQRAYLGGQIERQTPHAGQKTSALSPAQRDMPIVLQEAAKAEGDLELQFHSAVNLLPQLEGRDFERLIADLRAHGLRDMP